MKYLLKHTDKLEEKDIRKTIVTVEEKFKSWGLTVDIEYEDIIFDESNKNFYGYSNVILGLINKSTYSLKSFITRAFMEDGYDGIILFLNRDLVPDEVGQLRGIHTTSDWKNTDIGLMVVYSKPTFVVRHKKQADGSYAFFDYRSSKYADYRRDEYVLIHEILHDLEKRILNRNELHTKIADGRFEEYGKTICDEVKEILKKPAPTIPELDKLIINPVIKNLAIHHTAVSHEKQPTQLTPVNNYHREKWNSKSTLGWFVGYNYFIDVSGFIQKTREIGEETIANVGHNCDISSRCDTVSICLAGDFNSELPNQNQLDSLRNLLDELQSKYPNAKATFHRKLQKNRTCPGALFTEDYLNNVVLKQETIKPDPEDAKKKEELLKQKISLLEQILDLLRKYFGL